MPGVKQLVQEIHRRSLWQVLGIYVAGSWGVLQAVEMVVENTPLPEWVQPLAIVLLMIGLPVVAATAFVQEGMHHTDSPDSATSKAEETGSAARSLLTWQHTLLAGVGVFAVFGLLAVGWLVRERAFKDGTTLASINAGATTFEQTQTDPASPSGGDAVVIDSSVAEAEVETPGAATGPDETRPNGAPPPTDPAPQTATPSRDRAAARARESFAANREAASEIRASARSARIGETVPALAARADSAWDEADAAAAMGRYDDASEILLSAADLFTQASQETETTRRTQLTTLGREVEVLRAEADGASDGYSAAATLEERSGRSRDAGDLLAAIDELTEARDLYRAVPAPTEVLQPGPAEVPPPSPRDVVSATLAELSQAFYAEDIGAVRRVWVTLSGEQAANFETFFDRRSEIRVTHDPEWSTLVSDGNGIRVAVSTTWRYVEGSREQQQPAFRQNFSLAERDGRWVISGN